MTASLQSCLHSPSGDGFSAQIRSPASVRSVHARKKLGGQPESARHRRTHLLWPSTVAQPSNGTAPGPWGTQAAAQSVPWLHPTRASGASATTTPNCPLLPRASLRSRHVHPESISSPSSSIRRVADNRSSYTRVGLRARRLPSSRPCCPNRRSKLSIRSQASVRSAPAFPNQGR